MATSSVYKLGLAIVSVKEINTQATLASQIVAKNKPFVKMPENLETRCRKAVLRIADVVEEMNLKLCHIIESFKDFRNNFYRPSLRKFYNQDYTQGYEDYQENNECAY